MTDNDNQPPTTVGVELEIPTADLLSGASHPVRGYFYWRHERFLARGEACRLHTTPAGRPYGLSSGRGLHALDNGFNNLESSLGPVTVAGSELAPGPTSGPTTDPPSGPPTEQLSEQSQNSQPEQPTEQHPTQPPPPPQLPLDRLAALINEELHEVVAALAAEGAMAINFSEHPDTLVDQNFYLAVRAPKSIYDYQIHHRGWNHMAGLDGKAHNSPSTALPLHRAIAGLNILLGMAPAFIALFANSPFEAGRATGNQENRLTLWPRQMDCAHCAGDRRLHRLPPRPFANLADYFRWMFGPDTGMWFVPRGGSGKNPAEMLLVAGDPPLLDFLRHRSWPARPFVPPGGGAAGGGDRRVDRRGDRRGVAGEVGGGGRGDVAGGSPAGEVAPDFGHLVWHQFCQYTDCRLRYGLRPEAAELPDLGGFLATFDEQPEKLEEWLAPNLAYVYLEGRAAGANFADRELLDLPDPAIAASVAIAASALQCGLLANQAAAGRLLAGYDWASLCGLREEAIRHGLAASYGGIRVAKLCRQLIELAGAGLASGQAWMLAYPEWVLAGGGNGADRALARYASLPGPPAQRLQTLCRERRVISSG